MKPETKKRYNYIKQLMRIRLAVITMFRKPSLLFLYLAIMAIMTKFVLYVKK